MKFYLGYEALCNSHWVCVALLKFMEKVPKTHTHTHRVSVLYTHSHQTPTIHCFKQWISQGVTPKREIRSNGTTSMNSIRYCPYVLAHKCKCFEEIKRPLLGVIVSWLQHEVIVSTQKAFFWPVQREARTCMCGCEDLLKDERSPSRHVWCEPYLLKR